MKNEHIHNAGKALIRIYRAIFIQISFSIFFIILTIIRTANNRQMETAAEDIRTWSILLGIVSVVLIVRIMNLIRIAGDELVSSSKSEKHIETNSSTPLECKKCFKLNDKYNPNSSCYECIHCGYENILYKNE